jgi:hypothetical protein
MILRKKKEADVASKMIDILEPAGFTAFRIENRTFSGFPDLIIAGNVDGYRHLAFIEVKKPLGKKSGPQGVIARKIKELGFFWGIVYSPDGILDFVKKNGKI